MSASLHLIKLCVGVSSVEDLLERRGREPAGPTRHVTRMWPKREADLAGGSLYWVIKGEIQARQAILGFEEVDQGDGIRRCAILMDPEVIRVAPAPRRPFQGWRYLEGEAAPPDLGRARVGEEALPAEMRAALAEIGVV